MSDKLPELSLGSVEFETLRECGEIYVDKTAIIYEMAKSRRKLFLARPRRFGKSLLVSTFDSLFRNGLKYFSGLAIEPLWKDKAYTVIRMDFTSIKSDQQQCSDFETAFYKSTHFRFSDAGFHYDPTSQFTFWDQLRGWFMNQPPSSVVLLIDEYDAPLTANLHDKKRFDFIRDVLAQFYAVVKEFEGRLRFFFMTGITKFNRTGIFSELNMVTDISLVTRYGSLLGYTEEEIDRYFNGYVENAATVLGMTPDEIRRNLKLNYDGFCFDQKTSVHVYNPWSVLSFLNEPESAFKNYWVESGGKPNVLRGYLKDHCLRNPADFGQERTVEMSVLDASSDFDDIDDVALLTQAGYLTLKRRELNTFFVGYPNKEVADALAEIYLQMVLKNKTMPTVGAGLIVKQLSSGDAEGFVTSLNKAFLQMDYKGFPIRSEATLRAFAQMCLSWKDLDVHVENHNALGRSDLELNTVHYHWVLEFKFLKKGRICSEENARKIAADACHQISLRKYGEQTDDGRTLKRIALVFSEEKRQFVAWQIC